MTPTRAATLARLARLALPLLKHLALLVLPVLLGWVSADLLPVLRDQFPQWALIWAAIAQSVLWATPLTRQYGIGSRRGDHQQE
jgi:hypothetical protein